VNPRQGNGTGHFYQMSQNQDLVRKTTGFFYQIRKIEDLVKKYIENFYQIEYIQDLVKNLSRFVVPNSMFLRFGKTRFLLNPWNSRFSRKIFY